MNCTHQGKCFGACGKQMSPREINGQEQMHEHDKVTSRTTGKKIEINMGVHGTDKDFGGLVPANPFASLAQAGYLHSHPEKLGKKKLAEFDAETKGRKLPKRVK